MPAFGFWKNAKVDESKSLNLHDDGRVKKVELRDEVELDPGNQDSGVFTFEELEGASREAEVQEEQSCSQSQTLLHTTTQTMRPTTPKTDSIPNGKDTAIHSPSTPPSTPIQKRSRSLSNHHTLQRPTALNITTTPPTPPSTLLLTSTSQTKAPLRSPTHLLQQRLNGTPTPKPSNKPNNDTKPHFTPPSTSKCLLPTPTSQTSAFTSSSVRAYTASSGRPAWWCRVDKLVIFDGVQSCPSTSTSTSKTTSSPAEGDVKLLTRTSKGLSISRRTGQAETIVIPMECEHCCEMLRRREWKYDVRVEGRGVCGECRARCVWEVEREVESGLGQGNGGRARVDSLVGGAV